VSLSQRIEQMRPNLAVLERVGAMPGQASRRCSNSASLWNCAGHLGRAQSADASCGAGDVETAFRLPADKELSRGLALRTWPASDRFGRKKDHAGAEAACWRFLIDARPDRQAP